jgi:hypothetical protein
MRRILTRSQVAGQGSIHRRAERIVVPVPRLEPQESAIKRKLWQPRANTLTAAGRNFLSQRE